MYIYTYVSKAISSVKKIEEKLPANLAQPLPIDLVLTCIVAFKSCLHYKCIV